MNEYPTEEQLHTLGYMEAFNLEFSEMVDYIRDCWSDYGKLEFDGTTLFLATGGWSGNEDIVNALAENVAFWDMYWVKTERGGGYTFRKG